MVDAIRKIKTNSGEEYAFYCESNDTRNGFKHTVQLFVNDVLKASHKICYLNRTWESYRFQSCMNGCIYNLMDDYYSFKKEEYKRNNNLSRMTAKHNEMFNKLIEDDSLYSEYREIIDKIYSTNFY